MIELYAFSEIMGPVKEPKMQKDHRLFESWDVSGQP